MPDEKQTIPDEMKDGGAVEQPVDKPEMLGAGAEQDESFAGILRQFSATFTSEVKGKIDRLGGIVGASHWLSVGNYKEAVIRDLLRS